MRCEQALAAARAKGQLAADAEPKTTAVALAAFADGLAMHREPEPGLITKERIRDLLREYMASLFTSHADHCGEPG